jgi:hypothetical protein
MTNDDLDQILSADDEIFPSSGFTARVMDSLRTEASLPPPIPFPWKWAAPGVAAVAAVLVVLIIAFSAPPPSVVVTPPALVALLSGARQIGLPWIALALFLTFTSVRLARVR